MNRDNKAVTVNHLSSVAFALPWCCILPSGLSFLAVSFSAVGRVWLGRLIWVLFPMSVLFLGRAIWLNYIRRQGAPWTRWVTLGSTGLVLLLWFIRFGELMV